MTGTIFLALALFFAIELIRVLPWPAAWKRRKPLACSVCCCGWALIAVATIQLLSHHTVNLPELLTAGGLTVLLLALHAHWAGPSLGPPEG